MLKENQGCQESFSDCSQVFPLCCLHVVNLQEEPMKNLSKMGELKLLVIYLKISLEFLISTIALDTILSCLF
jgi:hypothetical protein